MIEGNRMSLSKREERGELKRRQIICNSPFQRSDLMSFWCLEDGGVIWFRFDRKPSEEKTCCCLFSSDQSTITEPD